MYKTKVQALQAADDGYRTRGTRLWVYRCDSCGTWHLTHSAPIPEYGEGGGRGGHGDASRRKPMSRKRGYKPRRR